MIKINRAPQSPETFRWYAIRTEPNRETVAYRHLETWIEDLYMPVCERSTILDLTEERWRDGERVRVVVDTQRVSGPILRGYLFARLAMSEPAAIEIGKTNGVLKLYPNNSKPYAIPDEDFARLKTCCELLASSSVPEENYRWMIGKILRITAGTYAGYQGECTDVVKGHAIMTLEMFKTSIPVPVPVECIEPEHVKMEEENHIVKSTRFGYKQDFKIAR